MAGLYLHIPFCARACHYCDFHFSTSTAGADGVLAAMAEEARLVADYLSQPIGTLYLGGGTPSVLMPGQLTGLLGGIGTHLDLTQVEEFTLEANPEHVTAGNAMAWRAAGINRISLGVQTFDDAALRGLNRGHTGLQAEAAVKVLQRAGFENLSVDLIFALPGQTMADLEHDLDRMLGLGIQHVSLYCLTLEGPTVFGRRLARGQMQAVAEDLSADMMARVWQRLEAAGFEGYEISNYALPGRASQHNSNYWHGVPYLGLGPSAHSYDGRVRSWNVRSNGGYVQAITAGRLPREHETLTPANRHNERLMTGLRLSEGIALSELEVLLEEPQGAAWSNTLARHIAGGSLAITNGRLCVTPGGRLLADYLAGELFV